MNKAQFVLFLFLTLWYPLVNLIFYKVYRKHKNNFTLFIVLGLILYFILVNVAIPFSIYNYKTKEYQECNKNIEKLKDKNFMNKLLERPVKNVPPTSSPRSPPFIKQQIEYTDDTLTTLKRFSQKICKDNIDPKKFFRKDINIPMSNQEIIAYMILKSNININDKKDLLLSHYLDGILIDDYNSATKNIEIKDGIVYFKQRHMIHKFKEYENKYVFTIEELKEAIYKFGEILIDPEKFEKTIIDMLPNELKNDENQLMQIREEKQRMKEKSDKVNVQKLCKIFSSK